MESFQHEPSDSDNSITALLSELNRGNRDVEEFLIPKIYDELRRVAARRMRSERVGNTLQTTALVNEAYLRLVDMPAIPWQNRAHFFAIASRLMRRILVDHARARHAGKRGGFQHQVTLDEALLPAQQESVDVLALHEALERLTEFDSRQGRLVELHFFGGLSFEEIALVLHISERTAKRDWKMARAWLKNELTKQQ
jgi:RNA polymerase sigma-70 factor, ECF subfamily